MPKRSHVLNAALVLHAIALLMLTLYLVSFGSGPWVISVGDAEVEVVAAAPHPAAGCDVVVAAPGDGRLAVMALPVCPGLGELVKVWYLSGSNLVGVDERTAAAWAVLLNILHIAILVAAVYESLLVYHLMAELARRRVAALMSGACFAPESVREELDPSSKGAAVCAV